MVNGHSMRVFSEKRPNLLPWDEIGVDLVIEATGRFREKEQARRHLEAGAQWVLISAPAEGADLTTVMGVNDHDLDADRHQIISNASCTTNALAPAAMVLHRTFGLVQGFVNTVHGYTLGQSLLDAPRGKGRRDRAAALNLVPTTTGAARAIGLVLPELAGRLDGLCVRTPNPSGSLVDLTAWLRRPAGVEEINDAFRRAAASPELRGILAASEEELVSSDVIGDPHSSIVDLPSTMSQGNLVKVLAWYDNEWGYASRIVDLASRIRAAASRFRPVAAAG
jgi:glyceraldehyde 3-phosphate dehydrogenase